MAKFHSLDLFDMEHSMGDLVAKAELGCPQLTSIFGTTVTDDSGMELDTDLSQSLTVEQVLPLYWGLNSLQCMVDKRVYIQQMDGTTKIGYVPMYNHFLKMKDTYTTFSGSSTDRDFWAHQKLDFEKEILKDIGLDNFVRKFCNAVLAD